MKKTICWLLAFLLTGTVALLGLTGVFSLAVAPALKDGGTTASTEIQDAEMNLIRDRVEMLSEIYGFSPEGVMETVTPEVLAELNAQSAAWWNTLLAEGTTGQEPSWDNAALLEALAEDDNLTAGMDAETADLTVYDTANVVSQAVVRTVLPMRQNLMTLALTKVGQKADIPDLLRFATGVPAAAASVCLLLAGLIALLESRRLRESLGYIGSALGGGAILLCAAAALVLLAPVSGMIGEASPSLQLQYDALASGAAVRLGIFAAVLLAGCVLCLCFRNRSGKKAEGPESGDRQ